MDFENKKDAGCSENEHSCGCGCSDSNKNDCCGDHDHDDCGCGCGCEHDHGNQYLTLLLEDDSEMRCQILGTFENDGHSYIALLHPTEETVFIFRCIINENQTIDIEEIEDDGEYEAASKLFMSLYNC